MVTNEEIMAELKKVRQEQEGFTNIILSIVITHALGGSLPVDEIMVRTAALIDEKRAR